MKLTEIVSGSVEQQHAVTVEIKNEKFCILVKTRDGVVVGDYKTMRTSNGKLFSFSDSTRKKCFKEIKQYVEASIRTNAVTCGKIIEDMDKYKIQLADNMKISATKFQAMQEAIYGCKVIVRRIFGEKQKVENAIVK
jgi:hypothetical protein